MKGRDKKKVKGRGGGGRSLGGGVESKTQQEKHS